MQNLKNYMEEHEHSHIRCDFKILGFNLSWSSYVG